MPLFAFEGTALLDSAKVGILGGSLAAGVAAALALRKRPVDARNDRDKA